MRRWWMVPLSGNCPKLLSLPLMDRWHTVFTDASKLSEAECVGVGTFHSQYNTVQKIALAWVTGHSGIAGNEHMDLVTKDATSCGDKIPYINYSHDLAALFKKWLFSSWTGRFPKSLKGSIIPMFNPPSFLSPRLAPRESIFLHCTVDNEFRAWTHQNRLISHMKEVRNKTLSSLMEEIASNGKITWKVNETLKSEVYVPTPWKI
ncbi:hypothetical protein EVAR_4475_1 [Eumeta japonica]|uniref:RNase H type-1 domain-containing protein n=1 Tax=Eumeta variegata TaxID=151549 RepID=A0A4C1SXT0_EUMVA|nr:hypothetical protein EVAR_4475_1 [Eumeta japonica]